MLTFAKLLVHASWALLVAYFFLAWARARRNRPESGRKANAGSLVGMAIEIGSIALIPLFRVADPGLPSLVYALAAALAMISSAFGIMAGVHLGKQLRMQAVVTEEHRLIVTGPYSVVRHPIYASMLGLLISIALVFAEWRVLLILVPVYILGTEIRVRSEDQLLAQHFGEQFEQYRADVKAYLPGLR
jgi:protein-S-isoprenylcysteine O-methyltransferase Ste14